MTGTGIVVQFKRWLRRWSKKYGNRWLVMFGLFTLAIRLLLTASTPQIPVPWYNQAKITTDMQGKASTQIINVTLPPETNKGWPGIIWVIATRTVKAPVAAN